ncbi:ABC transporter ATP-binding protein [Chloroflexota bacterium]
MNLSEADCTAYGQGVTMYYGGWWRFLSFDDKQTTHKIDRSVLHRIMGYARPYTLFLILNLLTIIIASSLELIQPYLIKVLIDDILPNGDYSQLTILAGLMIAISISAGLLRVARNYFSARIGQGITLDLRTQMYQHLQRMSLRFFTNTKSGEIISRFTNDVTGAQSAIVGTIPIAVTNIITLLIALALMFAIDWRLTLVSCILFPLFLLPARRVGLTLRKVRRKSMEYNADMTNMIRQTLSINGILLMKNFGRQSDGLEEYHDTAEDVANIGVRYSIINGWFYLALTLVTAIGTAVIYWLGGIFVLNGELTIGTIIAFIAYLGKVYGPVTSLSNLQVQFVTSVVSFERVFEYLDKPIEIRDHPDSIEISDSSGKVVFNNVTFSYLDTESLSELSSDEQIDRDQDEETYKTAEIQPTRPNALEDISFEIKPGELVALVGPSGAGKTTITYLLPRIYDPNQGSIRLDDRDLRDITLGSLSNQIGMVTQESYLFHDTVRANLLYAKPDASQGELDAATKAANIYDLIASLPDGYDTMVGEQGYRLSGGEKQRLAIARVIMNDPRILILDEATSHLDSDSEALIQAALEPLMEDRTSLVIAHRLSTILAADKILVLDQGHLIEQGTHSELLKKSGVYARLYKTQFGLESS